MEVVQGYSCQDLLSNIGNWGSLVFAGLLPNHCRQCHSRGTASPLDVPGKDTGIQTNCIWVSLLMLVLCSDTQFHLPGHVVPTGTADTGKTSIFLGECFLGLFFRKKNFCMSHFGKCFFGMYLSKSIPYIL